MAPRRPAVAPAEADETWAAPRASIDLRFGFAFGGDTLARATLTNGEERTLDAGKAVALAIDAIMTPLWIGDTVGLGFQLEAGLKYGSIDASNGNVSLMRWPLMLGGHALFRVTDRAYVRLGANVETHAGLTLSASGIAGNGSASLNSSLGAGGELGIFLRSSDHFAYDIALRYTHIRYSANGASADASNAGLTAGIGYAF